MRACLLFLMRVCVFLLFFPVCFGFGAIVVLCVCVCVWNQRWPCSHTHAHTRTHTHTHTNTHTHTHAHTRTHTRTHTHSLLLIETKCGCRWCCWCDSSFIPFFFVVCVCVASIACFLGSRRTNQIFQNTKQPWQDAVDSK